MPKRMTDTDKWKKPFIKSLSPEYKLFWLYLLDDCDHAGIWHADFEVAELRLGLKLSQTKAEGLFSEKVVLLDNGTKWFIPDFISFQYGELTEKNKMYRPVTLVLNKYNLMGHLSPINGVKDKEQVKDMVKDKEDRHLEIKNDVEFKIEDCLLISLRDERWVSKNKVTREDLIHFNSVLEGRGQYNKKPIDYKSHYFNWVKDGRPGHKETNTNSKYSYI